MHTKQTTLLRYIRSLAPPDATERTDSELLTAYRRSGDEDAFRALVARHGPMVFRACRRVLPNEADAEDAFQATFLILARKGVTLRADDSVGSWLYGVARRTALQARAKAARRVTHECRAEPPVPIDPFAELGVREAREIFDQELAELPARYSAPLLLCALEGLSRDEAAQRLGWSLNRLKSHLERARTVLHARLARRGLSIPGAMLSILLTEGRGAALPLGLIDAVIRSVSTELERVARLVTGPGSARAVSVPAGTILKEASPIMCTKPKVSTLLVVMMLGLGVVGGGVLAVLTGNGNQGLGPFVPNASAAPVPPEANPQGVIWVRYPKTGKIVSLTPAGRTVREVKVKDSPFIYRISPADNRIWFAGRDGQALVELGPKGSWPEGRITLHTRALDDSPATDLGIAVNDAALVFRNGKTIGTVDPKPDGIKDRAKTYELVLTDVKTKKVTQVNLLGNYRALDLAPDGKWLLALEYNIPVDAKGAPPYRIHQVPVNGGKARLLSGSLSALYGNCISPDGTRVLTFPVDRTAETGAPPGTSVHVIDVDTSKATSVACHENQLWSNGVWSPDSKRIAYAWRSRNTDGQPISSNGVPPTRLVVCDADGRNASTVLTNEEDFILLGWSK